LQLREKRRAARAQTGAAGSGAPLDTEAEPDEGDPELRGVARRFYNEAVVDLDAKVGTWIDELEGAGYFERGVLVLTADHGNSYGEHEQTGHGGDMYDIKLRVPLLLAGRGLTPRAVHGVVSLI